jgi:FkbH-like protein
MKFIEALQITQRGRETAAPFGVTLACGFTPLHLQTFLAAHLQQRLPDRRVEIKTGLYGDLPGTIETLAASATDAAAIAIEWADLDPRLQYREAGGWSPSDLVDILKVVEARARRLESAILSLPEALRVAISLPTLPLPPVFLTPGWQSSEAEFQIRQAAMALGRAVAARRNAAVLSAAGLDEASPPAGRLDLKSELFAGLPYSMAHADAIASALAALIQPAAPKKGLITDLDDTLWKGIVGDVGTDGVSWDLASHSQIHGLYQQVLRALAAQGALIGVASKNDAEVVDQVFARPDMRLPKDSVFPLEVHWNAKSGSVARILKAWNIGADSVVYVDDSPMELAEVEQAHPGIHCVRFPTDDYAGAARFLSSLRSLFGKARLTEEDALRLNSLRQGAAFQQLAEDGAGAPEDFLAQMEARITVDFERAAADPRVLELVNKTNQFNLNGLRYSEADWRKEVAQAGAFVASIGYEDKFGPLGKIAVIRGRQQGSSLTVGTWVMSCRAFARRVEHQCVRILFDRFSAARIEFEFSPTAKNGPLQEFFAKILDEKTDGRASITREAFESKCPPLHHTLKESTSPQPELVPEPSSQR